MKFFRNKDFFVSVVAFVSLSALAVIAAFTLFGGFAGIFVFCLCLCFCAIHLIITARRYRSIDELSAELDSMLHGDALLDLAAGSEGELSVLRSEIYKMTVKLREQADALEEDKVFLSNAMADVSHQLRTPLTSLNLTLTLLKKPDITGARRDELLRDVSKLIGRIDWLVTSLLIMAKIDAGTARFRSDPVSLRELIKRAYAPLEIPMELKSQEFKLDMEGNEAFTGDMNWSVEAVGNILKNAMEHTQEGGRICVACTENALCTEIVISDNGPGIAPEDLPNLFSRFYKGKGSPEGSVGIGLALSQMIISQQNGSVKAENAPYGGARFTIRFYKATI